MDEGEWLVKWISEWIFFCFFFSYVILFHCVHFDLILFYETFLHIVQSLPQFLIILHIFL